MLFDYYSFIVNSHLREKIYKGINIVYDHTNYNTYLSSFKIDRIDISFLFKNTYSNKIVFYSFLVLMEKLTLSKFRLLKVRDTVVDFNVKKGMIFGASYILRGYKKDRFLYMLSNYSLKKNNPNFVLSVGELLSNKELIDIINTNCISFGLNKFLFHGVISSSNIDYEFFYPLINRFINGMNIDLYFNFSHFLVNRLLLSHYNIGIY